MLLADVRRTRIIQVSVTEYRPWLRVLSINPGGRAVWPQSHERLGVFRGELVGSSRR